RSLAEVVPRGGLDTVPAVSERDLVQIRFEYLLLGVVLLHFARGGLFAQLATDRDIRAVDDIGMHVPDELLGDRTRAARSAEDVVLDRPGDADEVHAVMLIKAVIFDGDERFRQIGR